MLKLKTKVSSNGNLIPIELQDFYLSPDLSYVSGTTSGDYMFPLNDTVIISTQYTPAPDMLEGTITDITRKGEVIINKRYPVMAGKHYAPYTPIPEKKSGTTYNFNYIFLGGKYYYEQGGVYTVNGNTYTAQNNSVTIPTTYYIEDETVNIDGQLFYVDFDGELNNGTPGCLLDKEGGEPVNVYSSGGSLYQYVILEEMRDEKVSAYSAHADVQIYSVENQKRLHKVIARKNEDKAIAFDSVTFCKRDYYVTYKNYKCKVEEKILDETLHEWEWGCYIPIMSTDGHIDNKWYSLFYDDIGSTHPEQFRGNGHKDIDEWLTERIITMPYVIVDNQKYLAQPVIRNSNEGKEIIIYAAEGNLPFKAGSVITLKRGSAISYKVSIQSGETSIDSGTSFVFYNGQKYAVKARLCDYINIGGETFHVSYPNGTEAGKNASVGIYDTPVTMTIGNDGKLYREGYYMYKSGTGATYSAQTTGYTIYQQSGITMGDYNYPLTVVSGDAYLRLYDDTPHRFIINQVLGSAAYICTPYFENTDLTEAFIRTATRGICREVVENQSAFNVFYENSLFGTRKVEPINGFLVNSAATSSDDFCKLEDSLRIYVNNGYVSVDIPMDINVGTNLIQDMLIGGSYVNERAGDYINPIVDMEKDIFSPALSSNTKTSGKTVYYDIPELEFNLHFRTRNQDNWKIIEDEAYKSGSTTAHTENSNWFVLDYPPYNTEPKKALLQETPDLLGLLYFTTNDVFYQKNKLAKSFLRLSFYDSPSPYNQTLLATSTIFVDEGKLYQEYAANIKGGRFNNIPVDGKGSIKSGTTISVLTEPLDDHNKYTYDETKRLSMRFTVNNKYVTDTSSEGFYIYIFKEYTTGLHPKDIYMKVEFNHAGVGKTLSFTIPMKSDGSAPLSLANAGDVQVLKEGIPLSDIYQQSYIHFQGVYDSLKQKYVYYFAPEYSSCYKKITGTDAYKMQFNLFEVKYKNEAVLNQ